MMAGGILRSVSVVVTSNARSRDNNEAALAAARGFGTYYEIKIEQVVRAISGGVARTLEARPAGKLAACG